MLIDFFLYLKERGLPVSTTEYLTLLEAMSAGLSNYSLDDFYTISRLCLIKNEANYDKFDRAFGDYFQDFSGKNGANKKDITKDWLKSAANHLLSPEDLALLDSPANDEAYEDVKQAHDEVEKPLENEKMLMNSPGNSPLGQGGTNLDAIRIEGESAGNHLALKPWESRQFKGLDDEIELGTRNIKMALRRLRKFAREGAEDELDLEGTIASTARNAGWLDLKMRPERRNKVKVLIMFDTGGSMDSYIKQCEELFSAVRSEFKHLEYFYFHNCIYDSVWRYDGPSMQMHYPLHQLTNKYGKDYKLIIVGDASMSPVEFLDAGAGSYHYQSSAHSGETWLRSLLIHYKHAVWLNPESERFWSNTQSIQIIRDMMENRMYPLTLDGLDQAMKTLSK